MWCFSRHFLLTARYLFHCFFFYCCHLFHYLFSLLMSSVSLLLLCIVVIRFIASSFYSCHLFHCLFSLLLSSRWDYGYQITAMANRTILVDNNTWNNTHISRVGQAMASPEDKAYEIMRELDVDYVLVIFGGLTGQ